MRRWIDFGLARISGGGFWPLLLRAAAGYGTIRVIGILASFAVGVQLARGLGVKDYGYYSMTLAVVTLAGIPSEIGMPILVTREVAAATARGDYLELFGVIRWAKRTALRTSLTVAVMILCTALVVHRFYSPVLGECLLFGIPAIPLTALARIRGGAIQGLNHVAVGQASEGLVRPILFSLLLATGYLAHLKLNPWAAMGLYSMTGALMLVSSSLLLHRYLPRMPQLGVPRTRRSLITSLPFGLMDAMRIVQGEVSIALAGLVASPAVVGLLRIANVSAMTAAVPLVIMSGVAMPVMASLYATKNLERLQKTVTLVAQAQFAGIVLLGVPLLLIPGALLTLAFGASFAAAAVPLRILVGAQIVNAAFGPNIWLLNMTHHERHVLRALSIGLIVNMIAVPVLAHIYGASGAAVALFGSMLCWNVITWRDAKRLVGIETSILSWPWRLEPRSA